MPRVFVKRFEKPEGWIRNEWSKRIRAARKAAKISQTRMARATGLSQTTISAIENLKEARPIDTRHLELICEVLGMEPEDLLYPQGDGISPLGRDLLAVVESAASPEEAALNAWAVLRPHFARIGRGPTP